MKSFLTFIVLIITTLSHGKVIVIDPGHGGDEVGAIGKYNTPRQKIQILEKNLTLDFALKLKTLLSKNHKVILTRETDKYLSLQDRANIALSNKAHIFLSIHFNSSPYKGVSGLETYFLDNHNDRAIRKLERTENRINKVDDKIIDKILVDLAVQMTSGESKKLAKFIHSNLNKDIMKKYKFKDRGVKPGLFHVLALSQVPGVLLEAGFLSNPKEISKVLSLDFQESYAKAVAKGVEEFLKK